MSNDAPTTVRTVHAGPVFTVRIESVTLPGGATLDAEIVRHPGSVVILPVTAEDRILLVRQYRPAIGAHAWELPAGSLKPGEDREAAARRECHEETGLIAGQLEPLGSFYPTPGYCDELMHLYRATALRAPGDGDAAAHPDEDESIEVQAFTPHQLRAMIADGTLVDLKTVAGLGLLGLLGLRR
jgi:ADP-ribose pyrophosphatase